MRTLCLLLILANVFYFTWSQLLDVSVGSLDRKGAPPVERPARIVLAREVAEANPPEPGIARIQDVQPPAVEPLAPAESAHAGGSAANDFLSCTSVGPFADLPQAAQAQASLRAAGFQPRQRMEQGEIWAGYWVSGSCAQDPFCEWHCGRVLDAGLRASEHALARSVLGLPARTTQTR
jgi:hypothetical protein